MFTGALDALRRNWCKMQKMVKNQKKIGIDPEADASTGCPNASTGRPNARPQKRTHGFCFLASEPPLPGVRTPEPSDVGLMCAFDEIFLPKTYKYGSKLVLERD